MRERRRAFITAAVALAAATGGAGVYTWRSYRSSEREALLARALPDASGRMQAFSQWRGKVLVVNFWATWCAPCREEIPVFVRLQEEYGARGLQFVGVAIDQPDKVTAFARDFKMNYPILIGGMDSMEWVRRLGNRNGGLPFTIVADREGIIVANHLGAMTEQALISSVGRLL